VVNKVSFSMAGKVSLIIDEKGCARVVYKVSFSMDEKGRGQSSQFQHGWKGSD
jgi:hypothetical protein